MSSLDSLLPPETPAPEPAGAEALLERARQVAGILAPQAEQTDRSPVVPRRNLEAVAKNGLLGLSGPVEYGGQAAPGRVSREVAEILAGACGVTHFVQAQHHGPVGMIASTENTALRERFLRPLCEGRLLAGVAFSHLRRKGPPAVTATPVPGGFRVSGLAPWVTSWGLAGLFVIAAFLPEGEILYFCQPGTPCEGLTPSEPLALAVMNASATVQLAFDDLRVPEDQAVRIVRREEFEERDRINTAHPNPAVFGIARTCIRSLRDLAEQTGEEEARALADDMDAEMNRCRSEAYDMADAGVGEMELPGLLDVKAWSLELVTRAAHGYVAAVGGRAMSRSHPAQRLMREAMFYTIQAQTSAVRRATLHRLKGSSEWTGGVIPADLRDR